MDAKRFEDAVGQPIERVAPLSGGDFAKAFRLELRDGSVLFGKTHPDPPPGFFTTEAAGLRWLRDAVTVRVPEVVAVSDDPPLLILQWVPTDRGARPDEERFGSDLAAMHRAGADVFGRTDFRTTGSQALPNEPADTWSQFLADRRLLPLAAIARARHSLSYPIIDRIEQLASEIERFGPPPEPPSRLHGDLWAGNRIVDESGQSWLIDPACFGGHREFDLAMMQLFGGFGAAAFDSYHEAYPLAAGWEERTPLHQLPPLIVHAIKFGGSYPRAVESALDGYRR